MFKFNFQVDDNQTTNENCEQTENDSIEHEFGCLNLEEISDGVDDAFYRKKYQLDRSDLLPNVYEGGFKTWECSYDLVDYLKTIIANYSTVTTVLEIGCGSGLPGFELNKYEQFHVDFQDFNREVIEQTGRQLKNEKRSSSYNNQMYFGDWKDLITLLPSKYYDLLLTSETIYNTNNYGKLVQLFDHCLKSNGTIYLAAKVYYFGVQGGMRQFEDYLCKTNRFKSRVIREIDANVKREILEIRRINS